MGIPQDDLGPRWLRDYGDVDVDVATLLTFGKSLMDELEQDYKPHAQKVFEDLQTADTYSSPDFVELVDALHAHQTVRVETTTRICKHADGIFAFANAAQAISAAYGEADAYSSAQAAYVETLLADQPSTPPGTTATVPPATTTSPGAPPADPSSIY